MHICAYHSGREGEGRDRISTDLPGLQSELIRRVSAVNNNTVLVLINGWYKRHNICNNRSDAFACKWETKKKKAEFAKSQDRLRSDVKKTATKRLVGNRVVPHI